MNVLYKTLKLNTPNDPPATPEPKVTPPAPPSNPAPQAQGDNLDEYGYEKTPADPAPKAGDPAPAKKAGEPAAPEKVEGAASGYGDAPPKVEEPAAPAAPAAPVVPDELDPAVEGLDPVEAANMKEFAKKHNVPKDALKAFADLRKEEMKAAQEWQMKQEAEMKNAELRQRAQWWQELKDDPTFGGEKFPTNVAKVDKLLNQHLPNVKNKLTESKAVMPPYLMRDLASLYDLLHPTEALVQGDPSKPTEPESNDPLSFYT